MAPTVLPGLAQQIYPTVDPQQAAAPAPQQQPTGILDSFFGGGSMTPNQQMMLSLGAGMLANSRKRPGEAFGAAVPQAMQQQAIAQKLFSEDEEKKRREKARQQLGAWFSNPKVIESLNIGDDLKPLFTDVAQKDPELIPQILKSVPRQVNTPYFPTEEERKRMGVPEGFNIWNDGERWRGGMQPQGASVTIENKEESAYAKKIGGNYADKFIKIQDEAAAANKALTNMDAMEKLMNQPGFYSGVGAGTVGALKKLAANFGIEGADGIESMETFNALAKSSALDVMGGSLGVGFSNADRDFVVEQVPNMGNTPEGNKLLIDVQRKLQQRKKEIAKLASQYAKNNNGKIDAGFDEYISNWAEQNPLFENMPTITTPSSNEYRDRSNEDLMQELELLKSGG